MDENFSKDMDSKKNWNPPKLIQLNLKKTQGGEFEDNTEDYASGTINTQPGS